MLNIEQWESRLLRASFNGIDFLVKDCDGPAEMVTMMASKMVCGEQIRSSLGPVHILFYPVITAGTHNLSQLLARRFGSKSIRTTMGKLPVRDIPNDATCVIIDDDEHPLLTTSSSESVRSIMTLLSKATNLLWVTTPDRTTTVSNHGCDLMPHLARAQREGRKVVTLNIQQSDDTNLNDIEQKIFEILQTCFFAPAQKSCETDYVYRDGIMLIPRLRPNGNLKEWFQRVTDTQLKPEHFHQKKRALRLHSEASDKPDSLYFIEDSTLNRPIDPLEIEIQAEVYGVNFESLVKSDHMKGSRSTLGECAGVVSAVGSHFKDQYKPGDRVCGWGQTAYASRTRVDGHNVHLLPPSMPYKIGASIPVAFITAYYALVSLANLSKGETVLIHAAADNTGQAALQIAQNIGAVIFTTFRTASEHTLLLDTFKLRREYILSIEAATFRREIKRLTQGLGVDMILDSLEGESLEDSWACVARFGKFVGFGRSQRNSGDFVRTKNSETNTAHFSVDVAALSEHRPQETGDIMSQVMRMFKDGKLRPIHPLTNMGLADIEKAFKIMQSRQHVGKLVIEASSDSLVSCAPSPVPSVRFSQAGTYVIAGEFGALGLDVCRFMATRGAKHVALVSWGLTAFEQQRALGEALRQLGVSLHMVPPESSDRSLDEDLISSPLRRCPPIKGVVQADMLPQVREKKMVTPSLIYHATELPSRYVVSGGLCYHSSVKSPGKTDPTRCFEGSGP